MQVLATIREFHTANFRVIVDAVEEPDLDLLFDETGETLAGLNSGRLVAFCARVRVLHKELGEVSADYLGGCIYRNIAEFQDHKGLRSVTRKAYSEYMRQQIAAGLPFFKEPDFRIGSYFADMVHTAANGAREAIRKAQGIYIRGADSGSKPAMKIRFILDIYTSKQDRNGNRYTAAHLTATATGKSLWMHAHSDSNARQAVHEALGYGTAGECHSTEHTCGYREVMHLRNIAKHSETDITADTLADLEKK